MHCKLKPYRTPSIYRPLLCTVKLSTDDLTIRLHLLGLKHSLTHILLWGEEEPQCLNNRQGANALHWCVIQTAPPYVIHRYPPEYLDNERRGVLQQKKMSLTRTSPLTSDLGPV